MFDVCKFVSSAKLPKPASVIIIQQASESEETDWKETEKDWKSC